MSLMAPLFISKTIMMASPYMGARSSVQGVGEPRNWRQIKRFVDGNERRARGACDGPDTYHQNPGLSKATCPAMMVTTTRDLRSSCGDARNRSRSTKVRSACMPFLSIPSRSSAKAAYAAPAVNPESLFQREPLLGVPAARGFSLGILSSDCRIDAPEGVDDLDGEIAAKRQRDLRALEPAPGIGAVDAPRAEASIGPAHVVAGVRWLHRGDDSQFREPAHILLADDLGVLDPEPGIVGL